MPTLIVFFVFQFWTQVVYDFFRLTAKLYWGSRVTCEEDSKLFRLLSSYSFGSRSNFLSALHTNCYCLEDAPWVLRSFCWPSVGRPWGICGKWKLRDQDMSHYDGTDQPIIWKSPLEDWVKMLFVFDYFHFLHHHDIMMILKQENKKNSQILLFRHSKNLPAKAKKIQ